MTNCLLFLNAFSPSILFYFVIMITRKIHSFAWTSDPSGGISPIIRENAIRMRKYVCRRTKFRETGATSARKTIISTGHAATLYAWFVSRGKVMLFSDIVSHTHLAHVLRESLRNALMLCRSV